MKDPQRDKFIAEILKYKTAMNNTTSEYLKNDYQKKIRKMQLELAAYDRYHNNKICGV